MFNTRIKNQIFRNVNETFLIGSPKLLLGTGKNAIFHLENCRNDKFFAKITNVYKSFNFELMFDTGIKIEISGDFNKTSLTGRTKALLRTVTIAIFQLG